MKNRIILAIFITGVIYVTISAINSGKKNYHNNLEMDFNGKVEDIEYNKKGFPTVTIHDKSYYLGMPYSFKGKIAIGDSLIKLANNTYFKLIKRGSGEAIIFNGY